VTTDTEVGVATPTTFAAGGGALGVLELSLPQATRSIAARDVNKAQVRVFIKVLQMPHETASMLIRQQGPQCGCALVREGRLTTQLSSVESFICEDYVIGMTKNVRRAANVVFAAMCAVSRHGVRVHRQDAEETSASENVTDRFGLTL
jgi:hypothetical protein